MTPNYIDTGCDLNPTCLGCPIPTTRCPLFSKSTKASDQIKLRNSYIIKQKTNGGSVKDLAELFKVSPRTIQRVIEQKG